MKSAKIFLTAAVVSVFLFIGGSNALAIQTEKQIGVGYPGATTTSFTQMEPSWQPPDPKDPADQR